MHKNTVAPIIAILSCSELNMEISNTSIETVESDDCRGMSRYNRDANVLLLECVDRLWLGLGLARHRLDSILLVYNRHRVRR